MPLDEAILRTLAYYDIWSYPLTESELYNFLPCNSLGLPDFRTMMRTSGPGRSTREHEGYYFLSSREEDVVGHRVTMEENAKKLWKRAMVSMHVIKRFPFVRGIFVSGDLSKNATTPESDIDFVIVTARNRLWIARTLLIFFKKTILGNSKKYFCLNYFVSEDRMELDDQNIFTATEIGHLKPLYGSDMFEKYLKENEWIKSFFPNFDKSLLSLPQINDRPSVIRRLIEVLFSVLPADKIDRHLMARMAALWKTRYPDFTDEVRARIFRSTRSESRAYAGNYQDRILRMYRQKLVELGVEKH
jgi:hypothetical protein